MRLKPWGTFSLDKMINNKSETGLSRIQGPVAPNFMVMIDAHVLFLSALLSRDHKLDERFMNLGENAYTVVSAFFE